MSFFNDEFWESITPPGYPDITLAIKDMYERRGLGLRHIAAYLGVDNECLHRKMLMLGIAIRPCGRPTVYKFIAPDGYPDLESALEDLYIRQNGTMKSVGALLKISATMVRRKLIEFAISPRPRGVAHRQIGECAS